MEALAILQYSTRVFVDAENYECDKAVIITKTAMEENSTCLPEANFSTENLFV